MPKTSSSVARRALDVDYSWSFPKAITDRFGYDVKLGYGVSALRDLAQNSKVGTIEVARERYEASEIVSCEWGLAISFSVHE